jgi:hypothetical protein
MGGRQSKRVIVETHEPPDLPARQALIGKGRGFRDTKDGRDPEQSVFEPYGGVGRAMRSALFFRDLFRFDVCRNLSGLAPDEWL